MKRCRRLSLSEVIISTAMESPAAVSVGAKMSARILKGPEPKHTLNEKTLGEYFFKRSEKFKDRICQVDAAIDKSESFESLKLRSVRVALALQKRDITSNDVISFCSPNNLDVTVPIVAAAFLGAKITNLEPSLSVSHTRHLLELVTPKIIFVEENSVNLIEDSLIGTAFKTEIVVFGNADKYVTFENLVQENEYDAKFRPVGVDSEDTAVLFFSSGTTGPPKAIAHSHRSIILIARNCHQHKFAGTTFHFASLYWITAFGSLISCFDFGYTRIFCRNPTPEKFFKIVEKYKVEFTFLAPILTYQLTSFEQAHHYDTSSLKIIMCGGTAIPTFQLEKLKNVFKSTFVASCYGMSETGFVCIFDQDEDEEIINKNTASCGKPAVDVKLKVVDPDSRQFLGPNQKGEICIAGTSMMKGYYRGDFSHVFDEEGFLKTGDIGYYNEDGYVYLDGRLKEMFKYKSWHIIPTVIEMVLLEHPSIKEAVVFGIPHEEDGEVPAACVVLEKECALTEDDIDDFLKSKLADRERLRGGVTFRDSLPKTPSGKIVRKDIKDLIVGLQKT